MDNIYFGEKDLETSDTNIHKFLYNNNIDSLTYYDKEFTQPSLRTPIKLMLQPDSQGYCKIPQGVHFLENAIIHYTLPEIKIKDQYRGKYKLAWCENLAHNLFPQIDFYVDDKPRVSIDTPIFDDFFETQISEGDKKQQYSYFIGNKSQWLTPTSKLKSGIVKLPLIQFFWAKHISKAFPICALENPNVSIKIDWQMDLISLLRLFKVEEMDGQKNCIPVIESDINMYNYFDVLNGDSNKVNHKKIELWLFCGQVKNRQVEEHKNDHKTILYEYFLAAKSKPSNEPDQLILTPFQGAVKYITIKALNIDAAKIHNHSCYGTNPVSISTGLDPIKFIDQDYHDISRYSSIPSHILSEDEYFYSSPNIPYSAGYHLISYCRKTNSLDQDGSSDYHNFNNARLNLKLVDTIQDPNRDHKNKLCSQYLPLVRATCLGILTIHGGKAYFQN